MGHYRSEMGYEEEDKREIKEQRKRLKSIETHIEKEIKKKGIARVLAEIVDDDWYAQNNGL